jgi:site-specific DNA-methyltransferase (adenine-specific)
MSEAHGGIVGNHASERIQIVRKETAPATTEAQQWEGWGTALKPAFEPIVVARKPLIGTVAANVLEHGTGALNIDGSRIGTGGGAKRAEFEDNATNSVYGKGLGQKDAAPRIDGLGRWPANVILDEYSAELLDEQSGVSKSPSKAQKYVRAETAGIDWKNSKGMFTAGREWEGMNYGDTGGASRFFYVAKASKRDRNEGLEGLDPQRHSDRENAEGVGGDNPRNRTNEAKQNFHPTVKPTQLMRYLVKLVTPPGGTVLDPFTGSGSTGKAAILEGFRFIGCELTEDYIPIIEGRLKHAQLMKAQQEAMKDEALF